jgi:hypothetical protein
MPISGELAPDSQNLSWETWQCVPHQGDTRHGAGGEAGRIGVAEWV